MHWTLPLFDLECKQRVATVLMLRLRVICGCLNKYQFLGKNSSWQAVSVIVLMKEPKTWDLHWGGCWGKGIRRSRTWWQRWNVVWSHNPLTSGRSRSYSRLPFVINCSLHRRRGAQRHVGFISFVSKIALKLYIWKCSTVGSGLPLKDLCLILLCAMPTIKTDFKQYILSPILLQQKL